MKICSKCVAMVAINSCNKFLKYGTLLSIRTERKLTLDPLDLREVV